jgi:hypothetical protein
MSQERTSPPAGTDGGTLAPRSDSERAAILRQMERILSHDLFKHSRRYPTLFRYVVERTLDHDTDRLKERWLGIEVFGRDADYDTNLDPVVRTTAGEIRKRIAQYYHESGHGAEIRIDLPVGSYVPEFQAPAESEAGVPTARPSRRRRAAAVTALGLIAVSVAALLWSRPWAAGSAVDQFWRPVLDSPNSVLMCVGHPRTGPLSTFNPEEEEEAPPPATQSDAYEMPSQPNQYVALSDATTLSRLAGFLHTKGKTYRIQGSAFTSLTNLREGPVILIGAFTNTWTMKLDGPLRYSFEKSSTRNFSWIQDRLHPEQRDWAMDWSQPYLADTKDFAVISRVRHPATDRLVLIVAGMGRYGTIAAGEFLTDHGYMDAFSKAAPPGWQNRNIQIVLATSVIKGNSGPPRVVATHFW